MSTKSILYITVLSGAIIFMSQVMAINFKRKLTKYSIKVRTGKSKLLLTGIVWSESFTN